MSNSTKLSPRQQELARIGEQYLEALAPGLDFGVEALADEGAVYVWQLGYGGNQLIVGDDSSLLFGTSALWRDPMIESWRAGKRTSAADLDAAAGAATARRIVADPDVDADGALLAFAAKGRIASVPPKDAVIRLSDMETADAIFERNGRFELETRNRGSAPRVVMSSDSLESVRRYLVLTLGVNVRAQLRLPSTAVPSEVSDLPEGFELDDSGEQVVLQWDADGDRRSARFPRNRTGMREAVSFAHVARMPEQELIDALVSPRGVVVEGPADQREPTSKRQRLIDVGTELFARIAPGLELSVRLLPEDDAVVVYRAARGGGSIYVAPDETVLFASSAAPPHEALKAFREGRRTPKEQFVYRPLGGGR